MASIWLISATLATFMVAPVRIEAIVRFEISLGHAIFFIAVANALTIGWRGAERTLLLAIALGAAVYAVLVPLLVWLTPMDGEFIWSKIAAGTTNYRQLGFYGLTAVSLAAGLLATAPDRKRDILLAATMTLGFFLTFWSGGRAAAGGVFVSIILIAALCQGARRARYLGFVAATCFAGAVLATIYLPYENMGLLRLFLAVLGTHVGYDSGRTDFWNVTLAAIFESPWVGHGEGQWRHSIAIANQFNHPHNAVLQLLYQWGFVGTVALVGAVLPSIIAACRKLPENRPIALPALACIAGHLAMAQFEGNLFHVYPVMVIALCLAVLAASAPIEAGQVAESHPDSDGAGRATGSGMP